MHPDADCAAGWFCSGGSPSPTPPSNSTYGGKCDLGEYCPMGSTSPRPCEGGLFCASDDGLPDGFCSEGFFCQQGSFTPTPRGQTNRNGIIGDICYRGHYCEIGSIDPEPCPEGTFSSTLGAFNESTCQLCPAGLVCPDAAQVNATEPCDAGFYCPVGSSQSVLECFRGHSCPGGNALPLPC